ncbi:adenylate/guanylate cyclase domain-containing protein [Stappia sediminis]|nr:adenylate/guanylate cyclase domain-containing protein [Stappia sediminis]
MRRRISTLLFAIFACIAGLVLMGLIVMTVRLFEIRSELSQLRDNALPRLVKLAQLSQEASATSSIAPALSSNPSRSEFDTLLSRINDKENSQRTLIEELDGLYGDEGPSNTLRKNGNLLTANLAALTDVVREQIAISERLEDHEIFLRGLLEVLSDGKGTGAQREGIAPDGDAIFLARVGEVGSRAILKTLNLLLDPNRARLSHNQDEIDSDVQVLIETLAAGDNSLSKNVDERVVTARRFVEFWSGQKDKVYSDKASALANEFRIKALAEENSLVANRLLSSASNTFWRASNELEAQVARVNDTTRLTLASIFVVALAFGIGNFFIWYVLKRRVFGRLDRIRDALRTFAETRDRTFADSIPDEIGEISTSLMHYMAVIDDRETKLAEKSGALEQLSKQLAKYLSPQVYDSIFSGKQEVKVASSRKKLTIFFSDIARFTETADRLESEELTQLLNQYLTEMSRIALDHGATIDKYVGDAILIFFGDPETSGVKNDALACAMMAIAMRRRMRELQDVWREAGIEKPLKVRMGIHTGYCTVGNFGSEDRMDYTIVGSAVNIAARLEEMAEPGEILISFETFAHVSEAIFCEERGMAEVRGVAYPVATYRVVNSYENLGRERRRIQENHAHLRLELDVEAMNADDRRRAERSLKGALESLLSHNNSPKQKRTLSSKAPETVRAVRKKRNQ